MSRPRNTPQDVFQSIDMTGGGDACWPWKGSKKGGGRDGRPYFRLDGKRVIAYRVVWELFNGRKLNDDEVVRHRCDNGGLPVRCCNPRHLEVGTHEDNMRDMRMRERHGLPHHVVRRIRKLVAEGQTHSRVAELYGVARQTVTDIVGRRTYKEVDDEEVEEG